MIECDFCYNDAEYFSTEIGTDWVYAECSVCQKIHGLDNPDDYHPITIEEYLILKLKEQL